MGGDGEERALILAPPVIIVTPDMVLDFGQGERDKDDVLVTESWMGDVVTYSVATEGAYIHFTTDAPKQESFNEWSRRTEKRST